MASSGNHWLVKSEPFKYSWDQFKVDKKAVWDGVRNFEARNNLRAMKKGDLVLFYHSSEGKEVVGIASVANAQYLQHRLGGLVETVILDDSYHLITMDRQRSLVTERVVAFVQAVGARASRPTAVAAPALPFHAA